MKGFLLNSYLLLFSSSTLLFLLWFSSNLYAVDSNKKDTLPLTKDVVLKKLYKNRIVNFEAIVLGQYFNEKYNIKNISLISKLPNKIKITIWPSLGVTEDFLTGEKISVIGIVKEYNGALSIEPLSKNHIKKIYTPDKCANYILPSKIKNNLDKFVTIKGFRGISSKVITSKKNKKHLVFTVRDASYIHKVIMYEGNWNEKDRALLNSGLPTCLFAEISLYKGNISLQTSRVIQLKK